MTNSLRYDLQQLGYLARTSRLVTLGHTRRDLTTAVSQEWLCRPVRGWVATHEARRDAVIAVAHGGILTGPSALDSYGVWSGIDSRIHVLLKGNATGHRSAIGSRLAAFAPNRRPTSGTVREWRSAIDPDNASGWRASLVDALASFAMTQPSDHFIAAVDSALFTRMLSPSRLELLRQALPRRLRQHLSQVDGRAEAGTESIARLGLSALSADCKIQVTVGPHRLDILIDGWLNIEIDSEEWHGRDRLKNSQRDTWLVARGYWVLRFDYFEVMFEWAACIAAVRETLALGRSVASSRPARAQPRSVRRTSVVSAPEKAL